MSDRAVYYTTLRSRASRLRVALDESIHFLMNADTCVQDIGQADLGELGELSATDHHDLTTCVSHALFFARLAEKATSDHVNELDRELALLGIDPLADTERPAG
ncbi:hypothetical protein [Amycolatopsis alkalitolerans]|uniref:Uncharacterized protein n=1 Tax=Amycolatopsis alkalitolerans TaxID=2547244 RepID=A0A5C4LXJ6_9PSEU|nr:hypothetical protein [Amycolatopsis alkalitolerans]TNC23718.1 hypothetical protein FG385_20350 [Amycolatopsis alkalitolerans]